MKCLYVPTCIHAYKKLGSGQQDIKNKNNPTTRVGKWVVPLVPVMISLMISPLLSRLLFWKSLSQMFAFGIDLVIFLYFLSSVFYLLGDFLDFIFQ